MATAVKDPLVGRLVDARYLVHDRIASGGMATVYLATDTRLERPVALKVMHTHLAADASFVARFTREARSAARLSHPGVVSVYDQGAGDGTVYLAMEYIPGRTLRDLVAEAAPLPLGEALDLIEEVLDGLAAAHTAGLVHRDVKPENVLVGDDGRLRVADFGLARAATTVTGGATSTLIGTVGYLAPELVLDGASDERADVYAAGVVLFELLTGRAPFSGGGPAQVAFRHVSQDLPVVSSVRAGVPAGVDALVARATDREPSRRPRDAGVMLEQVRSLRDALPDAVLDAAAVVVADHSTAPVTRDGTRVHPHEHVAVLPVAELREAASPSATRAGTRAMTRTSAPRASSPRSSAPRAGAPLGLAVDEEETPAPAPPRRRRRPRAAVVALVAVLVVLLVGGGGTAVWAWTAGPLARVAVPSLAGTDGDDATRALTRLQLDPKMSLSPSESVAEGDVVSTTPAAGARVPRDTRVSVVVSSGRELRSVPELVGKTQADAEKAITDAGLVVGTVLQDWSEDVPEGSVASQQTPTAPPLSARSAVDFTVSKGKQPIPAPVLAGRTESDAGKALSDSGLKAGKVTHADSDTVAAGTVISSDPSTGILARGDQVSYVVSDGPAQVTVPDLVGGNADDAAQQLRDAGLQVQRQDFNPFSRDTVRELDPGAGSVVEPGSTVILKTW